MNEEIEYAEMLEIPVSTVNTVRKKARRKPSFFHRAKERAMQDDLIEKINGKMQEDDEITADKELFAESVNSSGTLDFGDIPERIDTVRLYDEIPTEKEVEIPQKEENGVGRYETNKEKRVKIILGAEFAVACALCGVIFLTNIFMPESGINTFFRSLSESGETVDTRAYTEFTLSPVVSEYQDTELTLSKAGVLSFKDDVCVYPVCDGKVQSVSVNPDGSYMVKIDYSTTFSGVLDGLDEVYFSVGDTVKANIPVGYTQGEREVQVTMYSSGEMLSCFSLTEENCLAWVAQ